MEVFFEILKFTVPTLIALAVVYLIIARFLKHEEVRQHYSIRKAMIPTVTPVKLTAYERLTLFLERMQPESLLLRTQEPHMTSIALQSALLSTIRLEFEHNMAQQLYVSDEAFVFVKNAKESTVQLINMAAAQCQPNDDASKLSMKIMEMYYASENTPTKLAIDFLKKEIKSFVG